MNLPWKRNKDIAVKSDAGTWHCTYGAGSYTVEDVDPRNSPYFGKYPRIRAYQLLPYYSTIDDPVVRSIAEQLSEQTVGRDARIKAAVALSFVQQNIVYTPDEELYGVDDLWSVPAMVLAHRKGDCDCMTNLFVSIAFNMGIDVVTVVTNNHMMAAVSFPGGHGATYVFEGKRYYHMETTATLPAAGRFISDDCDVQFIDRPKVPSLEFRKLLVNQPDLCQ